MATTLVFDGVLEPDEKDAKRADKLDVKVTEARASGGVYIKYVGDDGVLEGTGDSFQWDKATNRGELAGNPATAVYGKNPVTRGERIIFDYPGKKVIVKGDMGGSITVDR